MPLRRRTVLVNGALVVVLAGVGVVGWQTLASGSTTVAGRTGTISRGTVLATVAATGSVISPGDVGVSFTSSGTVTALNVAVGDKVKKGQVLAKIDDLSARQALAQARGSLANAKSQLATAEGTQTPAQVAQAAAQLVSAQQQVDSAKRSLAFTRSSNALSLTGYNRTVSQAQTAYDDAVSAEKTACPTADAPKCDAAKKTTSQAKQSLDNATLTRQQNLLRDGNSLTSAEAQVTSAQDSYDSTKAQNDAAAAPETALQLEAAHAQVDSAQESLEAAQTALTQTTLRAPAAGTVASIAGKVGEAASSGSSSSSSGTGASSSSSSSSSTSGFIVLTDVSKLQVQASFSEADTASVHVGAGASIAFDALPSVNVNGTVASIAPLPTTANGVTSYTVTLDMTNPPSTVRAGQTTTVTVTASSVNNVLYVPSAAVTSLGGISTITVKSGGSTRTVNVTVGLEGDTTTQISGTGVSQGETVVIPTATTGTSGFPTGGVPGGGFGGAGGTLGGTVTRGNR